MTSFSGALVALLHAVVLIGFVMGKWSPRTVLVALQIGPKASTSLLVFGIAVWLLFYMAALPAHRDAGSAFLGIVDTVMPTFVKWLSQVQAPLGGVATTQLEKLTKYLKEPESG